MKNAQDLQAGQKTCVLECSKQVTFCCNTTGVTMVENIHKKASRNERSIKVEIKVGGPHEPVMVMVITTKHNMAYTIQVYNIPYAFTCTICNY